MAVALILAAVLVSNWGVVGATDLPLERMFIESQSTSQYDRLFMDTSERSNSTGSRIHLLLMVDDLGNAFDIARFRPDAAIVPTNTNLNFEAHFPLTQQILLSRLDTSAKRRLDDQANSLRHQRAPDAPRGTPILKMVTDNFVAQLGPPTAQRGTDTRFPGFICMIATDYPEGGSIGRRDLFTQKDLAKGVAGCLSEFDKRGARSVVTPLVGVATFGTRQSVDREIGPLDRALLECRLLNSIASIALATSELSGKQTSLQEIGVLMWEQDMKRLFDTSTNGSDRNVQETVQSKFSDFVSKVNFVFARAAKGRPIGIDERQQLPECVSIFGNPAQNP